ncbi:MAG: sodium transport system permease protein [Chloroflexia bacterium]|jgi:sodium transport system permease protein|nr:sodium transport system permease protein [Chloroflexia bacterium]
MWSRISNIWSKEITDNLRDKKALRQAILVPLIVGIFYAVFNPWISSIISDKARSPLVIPAQGIENAGQSFLDALKGQQITLEPFSGDLRGAVARGEKAAGLIIPAGFGGNIAAERLATLTLLTNRTSGGVFGGGFSADRLNLAISSYSETVVRGRVEARNISPGLLSPVTVDSRDLASPGQLAGLFAAFTLPLLFASIIGQGGLFVAIDTTAGEKERGTLESLLVTPATDVEVLTGKLAAVFTISCIPVVLTFTGFWAASNFLPESMTGGRLPLNVPVGAVLMSIPLVLFVDVVLMIVSIRTKAFKEAQSAAMPVGLFTLVPAMIAAFVAPTNVFMYLIPVYGPSALVSGIATGTQLPAISYFFAVLGSLIAGAISYAVALRFFNRERLLYSA